MQKNLEEEEKEAENKGKRSKTKIARRTPHIAEMMGIILSIGLIAFLIFLAWIISRKFKDKGVGKIYKQSDNYFWRFKTNNKDIQSRKSFNSLAQARRNFYNFLKREGLI